MLKRKSRNVSLTPEIEALVNLEIASKSCYGAGELPRPTLRLDQGERPPDEPLSGRDHGQAKVHAAH
jgi:hypothetical protein